MRIRHVVALVAAVSGVAEGAGPASASERAADALASPADPVSMTREELARRTTWTANGLGEVSVFVPMLGEQIEFTLFPAPDAAPAVTDKMVATMNDVLRLPRTEMGRMKELLWEEANFAFHVADYGVEKRPGETSREAHLREFGIRNPDDALAKSRIKAVHIVDEFANRYAELKVETGSENLVSIIVKNGRIVDFDDDGTHLGWFDEDERHAHKKRAKVMRPDAITAR